MCEADSGNAILACATVLAAIVGGVSVFYANYWIDRRSESSRKEERILMSLDYLVGGTQNRSAGIGLLEGLLKNNGESKELFEVFKPVVANAIIYLATTTNSDGEAHEIDNLLRLFRLWEELKPNEQEKMRLNYALKQHRKEGSGRGLKLVNDDLRVFEEFKTKLGS